MNERGLGRQGTLYANEQGYEKAGNFEKQQEFCIRST